MYCYYFLYYVLLSYDIFEPGVEGERVEGGRNGIKVGD
jgi:hypothetical protein